MTQINRRSRQESGISKGKVGNLQVDEKEQTRGKQISSGPPRNNGTQREAQQTGLPRFFPVC